MTKPVEELGLGNSSTLASVQLQEHAVDLEVSQAIDQGLEEIPKFCLGEVCTDAVLIVDVLCRDGGPVKAPPYLLDDLGSIERGKLLNELLVTDLPIFIEIQVFEEALKLLLNQAHLETTKALFEFRLAEFLVSVRVHHGEEDG